MPLENNILFSLFEDGEIISPNVDKSLQVDAKPSQTKQNFIIIPKSKTNESHISFLTKIFKAIKIELETDCIVLNYSKSLKNLNRSLTGGRVYLFGVEPKDIGINFILKKYTNRNFGGINYLFSDSLEAISADENLKRALWAALKDA